ncbi:MAG: glycosyltransferase [Caldisericia bacterium]|nr:glycosyltransferase [Caldisericia bacterium]
MINGEKIIIFSTMDFYDLPTRKQKIALRLSENNKVLYLEPPETYLSFFAGKKHENNKKIKINDSLYVLKLPYILPFGLRFWIINLLNSILIERYLNKWLKKTNFNDYILWLYLTDFPYLYKKLKPKFVVYDCVDDHSSYGGLRSKSFVNKCERIVAKNSNIIFTTTEELKNKLYEYNSNIFVVSNGVDIDFFKVENVHPLDNLKEIKKPIIGYFGAIKNWFDASVVSLAAKEFKDVSFVLVGPYNENIKDKLRELKNVYLLGSKPYDLAPSYIYAFDVCLIPFIINELTLNVSPLKLYEYFSFGKPVVTIPIRELLRYSNLLYIYSNKSEFIDCIDKALKENDISLKEKRSLIAKENSWNEKFNFMFDKISSDLNS